MAKRARFEEVGPEVQRILEANMDEAPARRRAREAFKDVQLGIDHILFKVIIFAVATVVFSCLNSDNALFCCFLAFIGRSQS